MFEDFYGLHVDPGVVGSLRGKYLGLLKENAMARVGGCMLGHRRILRLLQATTAGVFTNANASAVLLGADVRFATQERHTVHSSR